MTIFSGLMILDHLKKIQPKLKLKAEGLVKTCWAILDSFPRAFTTYSDVKSKPTNVMSEATFRVPSDLSLIQWQCKSSGKDILIIYTQKKAGIVF